ncbi:MAG: DinB family protein [Mucilaginibacter sp.]
MKAYFTQLFNYDIYANQLISTIVKATPLNKPVQLMAHLLAAQQVWLSRCNGTSGTDYTVWPEAAVETFDQAINDNHQQWLNYLGGLDEADFDKEIIYKNSQGVEFKNKLADILTHVINHGTHHRAQIGQLLKQAGNENLPNTDFIFYLRQ